MIQFHTHQSFNKENESFHQALLLVFNIFSRGLPPQTAPKVPAQQPPPAAPAQQLQRSAIRPCLSGRSSGKGQGLMDLFCFNCHGLKPEDGCPPLKSPTTKTG